MKLSQQTTLNLKFNHNLSLSEFEDSEIIFKLIAERAKLKSLEAEELLKQKFEDFNIKIPNVITTEFLLKNQKLFLELMIIIDSHRFSSMDMFFNQTSNENSQQCMYINRIYTEAFEMIPLLKSFLQIRRSLLIKSSKEQTNKILEQFDDKSDTDLFFQTLPPKAKKNKKNKKKKNKLSEQSTAHGDQIQSLLQKQNDDKLLDLISQLTRQSQRIPIELSSDFLNNLIKRKEQDQQIVIKQSDKLQAISQNIIKSKAKCKKSK